MSKEYTEQSYVDMDKSYDKMVENEHVQRLFEYSKPLLLKMNRLMSYYRCALMEIETKFNVLSSC